MTTPLHLRHSRGLWTPLTTVLVCVWLGMGLLDFAIDTVVASLARAPVPWAEELVAVIGYWGTAVALTPLLIWMLGRIPPGPGRVGRSVAWSFALLPVYIAAHHEARYAWTGVFLPPGAPNPVAFIAERLPWQRYQVSGSILIFLITTAAVNGWNYYLRFCERERAAADLELERANLRASLSEARVEALQAQLQPHFLFNALHAISTLVLKGEPRSATEMIAHLSRFLRMTLDNAALATVSLGVELEFLEAYLSIQRVRFGDRLRVDMAVEDLALGAEVPNLVFQPLVENSIRHGIASDAALARISVRAHLADGMLTLEVEDGGKGLPEGMETVEGVGLGNIRQRLEQLYPGVHSFTLSEGAEGGVLARITIPARARTNESEAGNGR